MLIPDSIDSGNGVPVDPVEEIGTETATGTQKTTQNQGIQPPVPVDPVVSVAKCNVGKPVLEVGGYVFLKGLKHLGIRKVKEVMTNGHYLLNDGKSYAFDALEATS